MIPTSFSGSSPPTAVGGPSIGGGSAHSTNTSPQTASSNSSSTSNNSALLGIASLILEGRALAEDEYAVVAKHHQEITGHTHAANALDCGRQSPKPSTSRAAAFYDHHYAGGGVGGGGSGSGINSFASAAGGTGGGTLTSDIASYLRRKASNSPESQSSQSPSFLRDYYSNSSSESAASSVDSNHSRWTQKLSQLRQESPSAQHHHLTAAASREQKVAVECLRSSEPEYVALAINTDATSDEHRRGCDFEIIRRIALNRINLYNSPSCTAVTASGGSGGGSHHSGGGGSTENFMCSLQSLASNTCMRVGTPIISNPMVSTSSSTPKYSAYRVSPHTPRFPTPQHTDVSAGSASSCGSLSGGGGGGHSPRNSTISWHPSLATPIATNIRDYPLHCKDSSCSRIAIPTPQNTPPTNSSTTSSTNSAANAHQLFTKRFFGREGAAAVSSPPLATTSRNNTTTPTTATATHPQQGPHCDQFLRKMGLAKGDHSDTEEHHCDMSYVNITCTRWRAYCNKMENIVALGEPLCIEVYLGPAGHKILLEQWIITIKEKQPPPTMTLPSLCSAIRSQLYFSQISAWCDLIKKSDKTIYDTGRLIYSTPTTTATSAAGDLATPTNTLLSTSPSTSSSPSPSLSLVLSSPNAASSPPHSSSSSGVGSINSNSGNGGGGGGVASGVVGCIKRRPPRLNIFYRIKAYDESNNPACFKTKPNVHNFPNVNISENCCVSVCLKSLPRITGGIPKIGLTTSGAAADSVASTATATAATAIPLRTATPLPLASNNSPVLATRIGVSSIMVNPPPKGSIVTSQGANGNAVKTKPASAVVVLVTKTATNVNKPIATTNKLTSFKNINCDSKTSNKEQHHPQQLNTAVFNANHDMLMNPGNLTTFHDRQNNAYDDDDRAKHDDDHDFDVECDYREFGSGIEISCNGGGVGVGVGGGTGDGDSSNSSFSTNYGNISHREKQLLKYRKRMLKRDKKQRNKTTANESDGGSNQQTSDSGGVKMEQGEDVGDVAGDGDVDLNADANDTEGKESQRQKQQLPNSFINSSSSSNPLTKRGQQLRQHQPDQSESPQQQHVKMISTGTQTTTNTCASCGFEKSMICLKCNPLRNSAAAAADKVVSGSQKMAARINPFNCFDNDDTMDAETASTSSSVSLTSACSISSSDIIHTPRNKAELLLQAIQRTPKANKKHKKAKDSKSHLGLGSAAKQQCIVPVPPKTPINSPRSLTEEPSSENNISANLCSPSRSSSSSINNTMTSPNEPVELQGCQVCKRQKTQHNFETDAAPQLLEDDACEEEDKSSDMEISKSISSQLSDQTENQTNGKSSMSDAVPSESETEVDGGGRRVEEGSAEDDCSTNDLCINIGGEDILKSPRDGFNNQEIMDEEYFISSTKLTPHIERCSLATKSYYAQLHQSSNFLVDRRLLCSTPPMIDQQQNNEMMGGSSNKGLLLAQFKTPTPNEQQQQQGKSSLNRQLLQQPHKQTPQPNLLQIECDFNGTHETKKCHQDHDMYSSKDVMPSVHNPLLLRRNSPKVNLTPIFCNPTSMMVAASNPIPIGNGMRPSTSSKSAEIHVTQASPTFCFESPCGPAPTITVQKSNSAPTLPNSPSLSPRFIKASALYKRRSRHLSDRSDRSSLGSDEQYSDEDIDSGMYSPFATSPVKLRTRLSAVFGRKPFLGNLEESLLQHRLIPKIEVVGFKLLLGASGGFCPTQLTIPAAAYFYELQGETLSTPYLCEIRLPRKGYNVPRSGTVQATLLNPMGTVVRMFVIPYDMRDMPALHQTFIRQRILADTGDVQDVIKGKAKPTTATLGNGRRNGVGLGVICDDAIMQNGINNIVDTRAGGDGNLTINKIKDHHQNQQQQQRSAQCKNTNNTNNSNNNNNNNVDNHMGHFISTENMKSLRYSIHLRFQTSRSGRLMLHTDIRLLIARRTDCDTAAAHAKGVLEAPNELITNTVMPTNPKYSVRQEQTTGSKI